MSKEKRRVPKLRFPGFTEDWEQRKADYIFKSVTDKGYPELPVLSASQELGMVYREQNGIDIQHDKKNEASYKRVLPGQFVIHLRSFQGGFAYSEIEGITSPAYTVMSFKNSNEQYGLFWKHIFKSETFIKRLETITYGIRDGRSISFSDFKSLILQYPSFSEQKMIGDSIAIIEIGITLHQRKLEHLNLKKKALLQKLFPKNGERYPELRFPGFTDAWEQRKFCDVMRFINGRAYKQDELLGAGKYKVLRVGNFYTNDSWYYSNLELDDKYYAMNGDLLYTWSATFGPHIWNGEKVIYHYHIWKLVLQNNIDKLFALLLLEVDKSNIMSDKNGSTMVHITKQGMEKKQTILPMNLNEQKQIARFLSSMDKFITLHQRKLEHLKLQKKALLQQLFV